MSLIDAIYVSLDSRDGSAGRHRLLPVGEQPAALLSMVFYCTELCTRFLLFLRVATGKLALTRLVKVDDEEAAAANTAGAVVLSAAREEVRAAEVALPAVVRFPSYLQSVDIVSVLGRYIS